MEDIYYERIKKLEKEIRDLKGESDSPTRYFPEPESKTVHLKLKDNLLEISYDAFDERHIETIDPFINHNVPEFIAACINYFRWDNALYDTEFSEDIDIEDELIRYRNFKSHP